MASLPIPAESVESYRAKHGLPPRDDSGDISIVAPPQKPSVGRIVHYVAHGTPIRADGTQAFPPACRAAIITDTLDCDEDHDGCSQPCVSLSVHNPNGMFFNTHIPHDDPYPGHSDPATRLGGTWHWPERTEA